LITINEMKVKGKEYLADNWVEIIITTIIFMIIAGVANTQRSFQVRRAEEVRTYFKFNLGSIMRLLLYGPIRYGYILFLSSLRTKTAHIKQVFEGFKRFQDTFLLHLMITIFTTLWTLLFIIPGIIASISYTMSFMILQDNPEMTAMQALEESKLMMNGHKMRYFEFSLSFLGWFIVGLLTLGIGMLFVIPYYKSAKIEFYEDLKKDYYAGYQLNY